MSEEFNLPKSSYEEIQKIIKGYSNAPENTNLEALSKLTGLNTSVISRNNKFLTDIGLITGGMKKTVTDLGKKLGRALEHNQSGDAKGYWKEAIQSNEKISGLATTIRIRNGMSEEDFTNHVLYVSGQSNTQSNRTGARCIVEILLDANLIQEDEGKLTIAKPQTEEYEQPKADNITAEDTTNNPNTSNDNKTEQNVPFPENVGTIPQIAINIQLHLPETENAEVYEKLFRALREQLISPKD